MANVPNSYIANNEVKDSWEKILQLFIEIEAMTKIGETIPSETFTDLNSNFAQVFPHFPNDYSFKVIYEQCNLTTNNLAAGYSYAKLNAFMENCYKPFQDIIRQINSEYTVIASARVNPKNGPAPLTTTFDARTSKDPSNETIPSSNFFRYYRDIDGIDKTIGIGPVLSYAFEQAGNYIVHLTVRSSNKLDQGIFDGEQTLSVDVTPKSAIINLYANSKKLDPDKISKIGVQEAQRGIVFD